MTNDIAELQKRAPTAAKILVFIRAEIKAGREFPSDETIAAHAGLKPASARDALSALVCYGHLTKTKPRGRCVFALAEAAQ